MAEQVYARRSTGESHTDNEQDPIVPASRPNEPSTTKPTSEVIDDIDALLEETLDPPKDVHDILEEIEQSGVLEVDPEQLVRSYVQRGGQ